MEPYFFLFCFVFNVSVFQDLVVEEVTQFVVNLSIAVQQYKTEIVNSSATISAIVEILNIVANVSTAVNETIMQVSQSFQVFL